MLVSVVQQLVRRPPLRKQPNTCTLDAVVQPQCVSHIRSLFSIEFKLGTEKYMYVVFLRAHVLYEINLKPATSKFSSFIN